MNETTTEPRAGQIIRAARVVPAAAADAYAVYTDAGAMPGWWGRTERATLFLAEADVRVGGHFRYGMRDKAGVEAMVSGTFLEVFPPRKLVFTWTWTDAQGFAQESRVNMEFLDLKDGTTRIVVTHEGLPPSAVACHSAGWHDLLQDLTLHFVHR